MNEHIQIFRTDKYLSKNMKRHLWDGKSYEYFVANRINIHKDLLFPSNSKQTGFSISMKSWDVQEEKINKYVFQIICQMYSKDYFCETCSSLATSDV